MTHRHYPELQTWHEIWPHAFKALIEVDELELAEWDLFWFRILLPIRIFYIIFLTAYFFCFFRFFTKRHLTKKDVPWLIRYPGKRIRQEQTDLERRIVALSHP
jgi:hypothetical protein